MEELLKNSLKPFWETGLIYNESLTMTENEDGMIAAPLMFEPDCILSVRSATLEVPYEKGKDWEYRDGKIVLLPDSKIPYFTQKELYFDEEPEGGLFPLVHTDRYILFHEGLFFHEHQIAVTYTCKGGQWDGLVPQFAGEKLPRTIRNLRKEKQLKMVLFGDSIAAGANASGRNAKGLPPYLPSWGVLTAEGLRDHYGAEVEFLNPSLGGMTSDWGAEKAAELVAKEEPDLVIIAFGMNDGTVGNSPEYYRENIRSIMHSVREANPDAEFILVATSLPNKEAGSDKDTPFFRFQPEYLPELRTLCEEEGAALADMTTLHRDILRHKRFIDLTANNVNHPNDFLIRWYAQLMLGLLTD